MWVARAMHEIRSAPRTWFATLTFRPEQHYRMQSAALLRAAERSIDVREIQPDELERLMWREHQREVTLWLKRVRKGLSASSPLGEVRPEEAPLARGSYGQRTGRSSLRYLLVQETHKSGLPHYHLLLHESSDIPVKHALLTDAWTAGFSKFKLVGDDQRAAFYVVKYLTKANAARVRASLGYGRIPTSGDSEAKLSVTSEWLQPAK